MNRKSFSWFGLLVGSAIMFFVASCATALTPQVSYQGRLTDENGAPLNGSVQMTFALFHEASGGTALYSETESVTVTDGLFDTAVGPASVVAGLTPEDLTRPLWLEVTVDDGIHSETLTPRQRLYGSPYAFTLMPGAVISNTMSSMLYAPNGIHGVVSIVNAYDGDPLTDPASPGLFINSETGLELTAPIGDNGTIFSEQSESSSDLFIYSQDNMQFYVDRDDNEQGVFAFISTPGSCQIVNGDLSCTGTKSATVSVQDEQRLLYAIESPEVWFEDFGSGSLTSGQATIDLDPLFAATIDVAEYHVFLTPLGDCQGLYVANKGPTGFEVRELGGGSADVSFDYRIVAHRLGYEEARLEVDMTRDALEEE